MFFRPIDLENNNICFLFILTNEFHFWTGKRDKKREKRRMKRGHDEEDIMKRATTAVFIMFTNELI